MKTSDSSMISLLPMSVNGPLMEQTKDNVGKLNLLANQFFNDVF